MRVVTDFARVVVYAARSHAALNGDQPARRRQAWIDVIGFEGLHTGARQEHAGIAVHHQWCARQVQVLTLLKEPDKRVSDLIGVHPLGEM
jgi:hypothetical protein